MNKQNILTDQTLNSIDFHSSSKSYSSRFIQTKKRNILKQVKSVKMQKAAILIQTFWRKRMILRRRLYKIISQQLSSRNQANQFYLSVLEKRKNILLSQKQQKQKIINFKIQKQLQPQYKQSKTILKTLAGLTFKTYRQEIDEQSLNGLKQNVEIRRKVVAELKQQKIHLQNLITNKLQMEQQLYLQMIRRQQLKLLNITKQKNQLQKQIKQKLVQNSKIQKKRYLQQQ